MHLPERGSSFTKTTTIPTDFKWYFHTLELIAQVLWQAFAMQSQSSRDPQGCVPAIRLLLWVFSSCFFVHVTSLCCVLFNLQRSLSTHAANLPLSKPFQSTFPAMPSVSVGTGPSAALGDIPHGQWFISRLLFSPRSVPPSPHATVPCFLAFPWWSPGSSEPGCSQELSWAVAVGDTELLRTPSPPWLPGSWDNDLGNYKHWSTPPRWWKEWGCFLFCWLSLRWWMNQASHLIPLHLPVFLSSTRVLCQSWLFVRYDCWRRKDVSGRYYSCSIVPVPPKTFSISLDEARMTFGAQYLFYGI